MKDKIFGPFDAIGEPIDLVGLAILPIDDKPRKRRKRKSKKKKR